MEKVVGVRFRNVGKIYYFNPKNYKVKVGDHVIVETARGCGVWPCCPGAAQREGGRGGPSAEGGSPCCNEGGRGS